jgi:hypothetical protein
VSPTTIDSTREPIRGIAAWLSTIDWLTDAAWLLTLGCLGCAILDSYTSLCVVGGSLGHIGSTSACPDFGGWDTRVFPLAVDMGWGGALFAVLRLARTIGLVSWRWWVVLAFELVTAAFTIAGNAFHGAVEDGAASHMSAAVMVAITCVASAVPGVVAVGSGFTLSVLISIRAPGPAMELDGALAIERDTSGLPVGAVQLSHAFSAGGQAQDMGVDGYKEIDGTTGQPKQRRDSSSTAAPSRPRPARKVVQRLMRQRGQDVTAADVISRTGVSRRHANRLLREERQPHVIEAPTPVAAASSEAEAGVGS